MNGLSDTTAEVPIIYQVAKAVQNVFKMLFFDLKISFRKCRRRKYCVELRITLLQKTLFILI